MLLLGIDLGTSSIKVSVVDAATQKCIASAQYPETEVEILSLQPGWAEQDPNVWWQHVQQAILKCNVSANYDPLDIGALGIAYQMHGLVVVDKKQEVLRHSIIWCDGRAIEIGQAAFDSIGEKRCLTHLLNSPGNFTASKLAWVKEYEPGVFEQIDKIMLPGDFISMRLTGVCTTTIPALSEGVLWDFKNYTLSKDVLQYFNFDPSLIADIAPVFSNHGLLKSSVATSLSLKPGIPVTYKAGDQINNAYSLNVMEPGEVAATAGTSGVIYGISDQLNYDDQSRINSFAHVNHDKKKNRIGVLMCINGAGIFNRWMKNMVGVQDSYNNLNAAAANVPVGSGGLMMIPFGNGPERMLNNAMVGAHMHHIDFNRHSVPYLVRAVQEGIAFAFRYGVDIMKENGMEPAIIRAGKTNLFLSKVFTESFVNATGIPVELYRTDGSEGAALGAGTGAGLFDGPSKTLGSRKVLEIVEPRLQDTYENIYQEWKTLLTLQMENAQVVHEMHDNN